MCNVCINTLCMYTLKKCTSIGCADIVMNDSKNDYEIQFKTCTFFRLIKKQYYIIIVINNIRCVKNASIGTGYKTSPATWTYEHCNCPVYTLPPQQ